MRKIFVCTIGAFASCLALFAQADTAQVSSTTHWVTIDPGQPVEMPNGTKGKTTMRVYGASIGAGGAVTSQWCTGHQGVDATGRAGGAGYCTAISDNGDMLYISFLLGADQSSKWVVMGGTGANAGATGAGTSSVLSRRGDGRGWTSKSMGSITTK